MMRKSVINIYSKFLVQEMQTFWLITWTFMGPHFGSLYATKRGILKQSDFLSFRLDTVCTPPITLLTQHT